MGVEIRAITEIDPAAYEDLLSHSRGATLYHTLRWGLFLEKIYGMRSRYVLLMNGRRIDGALPMMEVSSLLRKKRLVSLPFSHLVDPLEREEGAATGTLLNSVTAFFHSAKYASAEIRSPLVARDDRFQTDNSNETYSMCLSSSEEVWKALQKKTRNLVRKAQKSDIRIVRENTRAGLKRFYELEAITRTRQGAPMYPRTFFSALGSCLELGSDLDITFAYHKERIAAGFILLRFGGRAIYGYGASTNDNAIKRLGPNYLLMWDAIEMAIGNGDRIFDLGLTPISNEGLRHYKKQWAGEGEPLAFARMYRGPRRELQRDGSGVKLAGALLRMGPVSANKLFGPILLKEAI